MGTKRQEKPKILVITAEEKQQATKIILRCLQQESFGKEKQTHLKKSNFFIDAEGLMRARGSLIRSKELSNGQKQPNILDSNYHETVMFLRKKRVEDHHIEIEKLRSMVVNLMKILMKKQTSKSKRQLCTL